MTPLWDRFQNVALVTKPIVAALGEGAEAFFHTLNPPGANDNRVLEQSGEAAAADIFVLT